MADIEEGLTCRHDVHQGRRPTAICDWTRNVPSSTGFSPPLASKCIFKSSLPRANCRRPSHNEDSRDEAGWNWEALERKDSNHRRSPTRVKEVKWDIIIGANCDRWRRQEQSLRVGRQRTSRSCRYADAARSASRPEDEERDLIKRNLADSPLERHKKKDKWKGEACKEVEVERRGKDSRLHQIQETCKVKSWHFGERDKTYDTRRREIHERKDCRVHEWQKGYSLPRRSDSWKGNSWQAQQYRKDVLKHARRAIRTQISTWQGSKVHPASLYQTEMQIQRLVLIRRLSHLSNEDQIRKKHHLVSLSRLPHSSQLVVMKIEFAN